jgi:hypothetical protein
LKLIIFAPGMLDTKLFFASGLAQPLIIPEKKTFIISSCSRIIPPEKRTSDILNYADGIVKRKTGPG